MEQLKPWEQQRRRLIKKSKSNFWIWLYEFWADTPEKRSHVQYAVFYDRKSLSTELKTKLVKQWKYWIKHGET